MLKTVGFPSTRTGDQTIVAGNLVIGTAGQGIDFSINPATPGATSELLNDYEEGTWTPAITSTVGSLAGVNATGTYTKIGREVYITYNIQITANGTGTGAIKIDGLPFTLAQRGFGVGVESDTIGFGIYANAIAATTFAFVQTFTGTYPGGTAYRLQGDFSYIV
jgi:hypothetical protein